MTYTPTSPTSYITDSPEGTTRLSYIRQGQPVYVKWRNSILQSDDKIIGFEIFYRRSSTQVANSVIIQTSKPFGYFKIETNKIPRGDKLVVSVKVITSQAGDSATPQRAFNEPIINSLPTISSLTSSSNRFYGGKANPTFYFSGSSNDIGQSLTYYHSDGENGSKIKIENGDSLFFEYKGNDYKTFYTYLWAYDGYEMSLPRSIATIVHSKIAISSNYKINKTTVFSLGNIEYLKEYIITSEINKSSINLLGKIYAYIEASTTDKGRIELNSSDYSYSVNNYKVTFRIDFTTVANKIYDNWFISKNDGKLDPNLGNLHIGIDFYGLNGIYETSIYTTETISDNFPRIFKDFPELTSNNYAAGWWGEGTITYDKYYNTIRLTPTIPQNFEKNSGSIIVKRGVSTNGTSYNYTLISSYKNGDDNLNAEKDVEGNYLKYQIIVMDPYKKGSRTYFSNTLRKLYKPQIKDITYTGQLKSYKPLSFVDNDSSLILQILKSDFYINGKILSTYNNTDIEDFMKSLSWSICLNNYNKNSNELSIVEVTDESSSIWIKISNAELINEMKAFYDSKQQDGIYTLRLKISVIDEYGLSSNILYTPNFLNVDFRESPIFKDKLEIKHILLTWNTDIIPGPPHWVDVESVKSNNANQKVNPNELIQIIGPEVEDLNIENNAGEYGNLIYTLVRTDVTNGITETILRESGYPHNFIYTFKSSNYYSNIIKYKYTLRVEDKYGLSDQCTTGFDTDYDLIACPTNPLNNLNDMINFNSKKESAENNNYSVETSIIFKDNLFGYDNYSLYMNAERKEEGYYPSFNIYLYYATDVNTLNNFKINPPNNNNKKEIGTFTSSNSILSKKITKNLLFSINTTTYFLIALEFSTGSKDNGETNYIYTFSRIYTVDPLAPTAAVRKNYLGINTNEADLTNDTLLKVKVLESNAERVKIYLTGVQSTGSGTEITIDLSDGSIDGAIINGGTW